MFTNRRPDTSVHFSLLGSSRKRRVTPSVVCTVASRLVFKRSIVCITTDHGRKYVVPTKIESCAHGPNTTKSHADLANSIYDLFYVFPLGFSPLLGSEQHTIYCTAMAHYP